MSRRFFFRKIGAIGTIDGAARAYPWDSLVKQSPVVDHVHGTPLLAAVGPDGKSFRVFISRIDGKDAEFFLKGETEAEPSAQSTSQANAQPPTTAKSAEAKSVEAKPAAPTDAKADPKADAPSPAKAATPATPKPWILLDTATASEWAAK